MCDNHKHNRKGRSLDNKEEHQKDHNQWSRRDFLVKSGLLGAGFSMAMNNHVFSSPQPSELLNALNSSDSEKILVLLRFDGGNDGLNTIIPRGNNFYYNNRQIIGIGEDELIPVDADNGFHPNMAPLMNQWNDGVMAAIHNVSYPSPSQSHFRGQDIWASASDSDQVVESGIFGRYFETVLPSFIDAPPVIPAALQIGLRSDTLFQASESSRSLSIVDPNQFYSIAQQGQLYSTVGLGACTRDLEKAFLRQTANSSFFYADSIQRAYEAAQPLTPAINYPTDNLGKSLNIVGQMIKGKLGTKVYLVRLGGFDTHSNQIARHGGIMASFGNAVNAFMEDMKQYNESENVLLMTYSEFGRTWNENASEGTDHGIGGPMFLFGEGIGGGFHGSQPDLTDLGPNDDPDYENDFRNVYASVLKNWLCIDPTLVDYTMGNSFDPMPGLIPTCNYEESANNRASLMGHKIRLTAPNIIEFHYAIKYRSKVQLQLLNKQGQVLFNFVDEVKDGGAYVYSFNTNDFNLPSGKYHYRLNSAGESYNRRIEII